MATCLSQTTARLAQAAARALVLSLIGLVSLAQTVSATETSIPNSIRNMAFEGFYQAPVTLQDGLYEGEPFVDGGTSRPRVELVESLSARGSVDGIEGSVMAVLLVESSGGSGSYVYLALVSTASDNPENVATALIGDRVQVRSLAIRDGATVLDLVIAGPQDSICCPTHKVKRTYRLEGGALVEESSQDQGIVSLADLQGIVWTLSEFREDKSLPEGTEQSIRFEEQGISGRGGCNRYFGAAVESSPGTVGIGPLGATKMLCPETVMSREQAYLAALQSVTRYGFVMGRLALTYTDGGVVGTLLFEGSPVN